MIDSLLSMSELSITYLLMIFIVISCVLLALLYNTFSKYNRLDRKLIRILEKLDVIEETLK